MSKQWSAALASLLMIAAIAVAPLVSSGAKPQFEQKQHSQRVDQYGIPLPEHALFRIGTSRVRDSGMPQALAYAAQGTRLVSADVASGVHVWDAASGKELLSFGAPAAGTPPFAVSSDGSMAAVVESAELCRIYDTVTAGVVATLKANWKNTTQLSLSPDKTLLACAGSDNTVSLWDIASRKLFRAWESKAADRKVSMSFSPDGKMLALGSRGHPTHVWDVATGKERRLGGEEGGSGALAFSRDGKVLAVISADWRHFSLWDVAAEKRLHVFPFASNSYWSVAFLPDGKTLATGNYPGKVWFWDIETGKVLRVISGHPGEIESLTFAPDGKSFAAGSGGCTVRIWDALTGKELHLLAGHHATVSRVRYTADGKGITSICVPWYGGTTLRVCDAATGKYLRQFDVDAKRIAEGLPAEAQAAAVEGGEAPKVAGAWLTSEGPKFASIGPDEKLRVHDLLTGKVSAGLELPEIHFESIQLSDDGNLLACSVMRRSELQAANAKLFVAVAKGLVPPLTEASASSLTVWDVNSGKKLLSQAGREREALTCQFTPDGRKLAVHSKGLEVTSMVKLGGLLLPPQGEIEPLPLPPSFYFLDIHSKHKVKTLGLPISHKGHPTFSPSGRLMVVQEDDDETLTMLEVATGRVVFRLVAGTGKVGCVAFSADGRTVATGTELGRIQIRNMRMDKPLVELTSNDGPWQSMSFSPDGKHLVSASRNSTVVVWDVARWTQQTKSTEKSSADDAAQSWSDLGEAEPAGAYAAIDRLLQSPKGTIELLREHLKPVGPDQAKEMAAWIAALESPRYAERQGATVKLQKLGFDAHHALQKALQGNPSLEARTRIDMILTRLESQALPREVVRALRALETLEMLATPEAIALLDSLSSGQADAWLTHEAAWTLKRAKKRVGS